MKYLFWGVIIILFTNSCSHDRKFTEVQQLKDSAVANYLSLVESLEGFDTASLDFKLIKAIYKNDTDYLKQLIKIEKYEKENISQIAMTDSCIHLLKLSQMDVDEVYRFRYYRNCMVKCQVSIISVTGKYYIENIVFKSAIDSIPCSIIARDTISISKRDWMKIKEEIEFADFWGLKRYDHPSIGIDENTDAIVISGYTSDQHKCNEVHRWITSAKAINQPLLTAFRLAKLNIDSVCNEAEKHRR